MAASKGKAVADGKWSAGKRKRDDSHKTERRTRKNPGVLQFFEDEAYEVDESESSDDSDLNADFLEDEFGTDVKVKNELVNLPLLTFFPDEEMREKELEKMLEERYNPGSTLVTYAEYGHETTQSIEINTIVPSAMDPTIWKVKCMVGREKHSTFCLMQKYVDLQSLGTKLQIISVCAVERIKGFIFIEADKQCDVNKACNGLCNIYSSQVTPVPKNEVSKLISVQSKCTRISAGMWARVKNGKYKGDLAQVIAVNDLRKKATVMLIPRIDLQAMAEKFGGGITAKKDVPAPRLISSSELEEFRPLIQYRRDRDIGIVFEVLDGMMLKDGYLYKKVSIDSLSCWGIMPSEDELLKFEPPKNEDDDLEWLSQIYSDQKSGKGESLSSSTMENSFEVHDLVFFGRKGFGVIIGAEKDDTFKILKEGSEGPVVVTLKLRELKKASFSKKFTALDQHMKIILINDTVRVLEGPLEDRQGIVKKIYRGTIFLYDENEQENRGYFCSKAQICEKIKLYGDACDKKGDGSEAPSSEDLLSSPKSPLSPKKLLQRKDNSHNFTREDKNGIFSVGQSLRIRVGPLKGYLCRVMAIRHYDVTVKLDSQHKILTVKGAHLSEVRGKSSDIPIGEELESVKPFDLLGTQDGTRDCTDRAKTSTEGERWNTGGQSTKRSSWPAFPADSCKAAEKWGSKDSPGGNTAVWNNASVAQAIQSGSWANSRGRLAQPNLEASRLKEKAGVAGGQTERWGNVKKYSEDATGWKKCGFRNQDQSDSWNKPKKGQNGEFSWNKQGGRSCGNQQYDGSSWSKQAGINTEDETKRTGQNDSREIPKSFGGTQGFGGWNKSRMGDKDDTDQKSCWEMPKTFERERGSGGRRGRGDGRGGRDQIGKGRSFGRGQSTGWSKRSQENYGTRDARGRGKVGFGNQGQADNGNKPKAFGADGGSALNKQDGGSSWNKQAGVNTEYEFKGRTDQSDKWERPKSFGRGRGFDGWNKGRMVDNNDTDQQGSWKRPKTCERGGGAGERRGRGGRGGRQGGRGHLGRGRSFDHRQPSAWGKGGQENCGRSDGTSAGNMSGWNSGNQQVLGQGQGL